MSESKIEGYFFTAIFVAVLGVVGYMFLPFLGAIAIAVVLATLTHPFHDFLERRTHRPTFSAVLVTVVVFLAVILPAVGLSTLLLQEARNIVDAVQGMEVSALPGIVQGAYERVRDVVPLIERLNFDQLAQSTMNGLGGGVAGVVTGTADAIFKLVITMLVLFYMLKDGKSFLQGFIELSPLSDDEDVLIVQKLKSVSLSLIRGSMVIAVLQGLLTGTGLLLFGVPNPVLWGSVAAVSALIPTVGITVVTVPASIYLGIVGEWGAMFGFIAWSALIAGTVDNILGPKLIGRHAKIHPMFILLSVLGGLLMFGPPGFLIGPLLFGLLVALSEIYKVKIKAIHLATASS